MNLDDDSILTAFLDGELEPSRHLRVEAALLSSPRLAARLRELTLVRDAVRGLSRPRVPGDLAPAVLSAIEEADALRRRRLASRSLVRRRLLVLAPLSAVAAALLVAWSLHGLTQHETVARLEPDRLGASTAPPELAPPESGPVAEGAVAEASPTPDVAADAEATAPEPPVSTVAAVAAPDRQREAKVQVDQERFLQILGTMEIQRFLVEVDSLGGENVDRVEEAIVSTPRSYARHARFHVLQGLALDPAHPGEAMVFAVVLDDVELANFRENLGRKFPGADLAATPIRPGLVAQLAESEPLEVIEGKPSGSLVAHDEGRPDPVAIRSDDRDATGRVADMPPFPATGPLPRGREVGSPGPRSAVAEVPAIDDGTGHPDGHDSRPGREPLVYLVWLEKRPEESLRR